MTKLLAVERNSISKKNQTTADLAKIKLFAHFGLRAKESWVKLFTRRPGKLQDSLGRPKVCRTGGQQAVYIGRLFRRRPNSAMKRI